MAWFELDVDVLPDGTVIVIHDSTLDRTTDHAGPYAGLRREDLSRIDAGSWFSPAVAGEPVPTLDKVIDLMNDAGLNANIELKGRRGQGAAARRALVGAVVRDVAKLKPGREVLISSFSPLLLQEYHRQSPSARLAFLFEGERNLWWRGITGLAAVHPSNATVTPRSIRYFRERGLDVNVWTVNSPERAAELAQWGATGIFTDLAQDFPAAGR